MSAVELVVGHLKSGHRMGRNHLWHHKGDTTNAVVDAGAPTSIASSDDRPHCCSKFIWLFFLLQLVRTGVRVPHGSLDKLFDRSGRPDRRSHTASE